MNEETIEQLKLINEKLIKINNLLDEALTPSKPMTDAEILEEVANRG